MVGNGQARRHTIEQIKQQRSGTAEHLQAARLATQTHLAASRALVYEARRILMETARQRPSLAA